MGIKQQNNRRKRRNPAIRGVVLDDNNKAIHYAFIRGDKVKTHSPKMPKPGPLDDIN